MTRVIPTDLLAALTQSTCKPFFAVEFLFDSAPLRLWSGHGNRTIGSDVYTGSGTLITFDGLQEASDMSALSFDITLSGIDPAIISLALQEPWQNRHCTVYLGEKSVSSVATLARGYMDKMILEDSAEAATVKLTVETPLVRGERSAGWRYTDESHRSRYPNDSFFSYVTSIQDAQVPWGRQV